MENEILTEHSNALGEIEIFMVNDPLEQQKRLVEEVLQGIVTPESDPAVWEDDLLYLAVAVLKKSDVNWLETRLEQGGPGACLVAECMPG